MYQAKLWFVLSDYKGVFRVRCQEPPVGVCQLWHLYLSGVFRQAQRPGSPREVCVCVYMYYYYIVLMLCSPLALYSFVRSTTMDKWKDSELEKMKVRL